ncbi:DapH/DapD/GlmU-related protein [Pectobacterium actinidiae]|uniref:DapH/DapD/GlmU-related protein n=1 Tax=Pectobacterium actinidiae TaxID=1507808 RepID=UPI0038036D98
MRVIKSERALFIMIRLFPFVFNKIRNKYFSLTFKTKNLKIGKCVSFSGSKNIKIGNNVLFGNLNWIDAIDKGLINIGNNVSCSQCVHIAAILDVRIGDGCLIGSDVLITDHDHAFGDNLSYIEPKTRGLKVKGPTEIGKNVWLGDNVKILSGVVLGDNVVVAANAVVTKSFPSGSIVGGIPADYIHKTTK